MSEVKSARELSELVYNLVIDTLSHPTWPRSELTKILLSDRRAIIEKCKDLIMLDSEPHTMIRCSYACSLLDSVLSDLEKEE